MSTNPLRIVVILVAAIIAAYSEARSEGPASEAVDAFGDPLPPGAIARMGAMRFRHGGGAVTVVAYSPDGRFLASGNGGELHLWDAATGKLVRRFVDPSGKDFNAIAFSPNGELLASDKGGPGLWQVATGRRVRDLECVPAWGVTSMAFSPDGKELALGTNRDPEIRLFDPATGKPSRKLTGHTEAAPVVVYSRDGRLLASGSLDKTARVWDAAAGKELHRIQEVDQLIDVALSPDGKLLATKTLAGVRLWDIASGKEVHRLEAAGQGIRSLAFSPAGNMLASDGALWDVAMGKVVCECDGAVLGEMAWSPDGKAIAVCGLDARVHLFDPVAGKEFPTSRAGWNHGTQNPVAFTPDGRWVVLRSESADGARLCDPSTGKEVREYPTDDDRFYAMTLSPDGKAVAGAAVSGALCLWDTDTGKRLWRLNGPEQWAPAEWPLTFAPDGQAFAAAANDNVIRLWDAATRKELRQFGGHKGGINSLYFTPDGKTLVSDGKDETTRFWDVAGGKERRAPLKQTGRVGAVSPDGRIAAVYEFRRDDCVFRLREIATGREVRRITENVLTVCAFSPDGKTLAAYDGGEYAPDKERPILLLEVATGRTRMKLAGHRAQEFGALVFSADGRMLASGSSDQTTLIWDATGRMHGDRFEPSVLSAKELNDCWAALADDAAPAYGAIWTLVAAPDQSLPFLKEHLRPAPDPDPNQMARRLADLDADDFDVRERAEKELEEQGDLTESALRRALDGAASPELRLRVERLLAKLDGRRRLQKLRALESLERIGTPAAGAMLRELARGPAGAVLTEEAQASMERLSRRPAP